MAALATSLILLLVIGGVSPKVHDHLCQHHHDDVVADHCVIHAFASGEAYAPPMTVSVAPAARQIVATLQREVRLDLPTIDYRLRPACGPPSTGNLS